MNRPLFSLSGGGSAGVLELSHQDIREVRALAHQVFREAAEAAPAKRGRPAASVSQPKEVATLPRPDWLPEGRRLATPKEVERALGVGRSSLFEFKKRRWLEPKYVGRLRRFEPAEVERCIAKMQEAGWRG